MPTYDASAVADSVIAHKKGITLQQVRALRDNLIAMAEGGAGSPSILPNIAANAAADGIGTYVFAKATGGDAAYGTTRAGSSITPTSAFTSGSTTFVDPVSFNAGAALSGTWRCMGTFDQTFSGIGTDSGKNMAGATLWLRIS